MLNIAEILAQHLVFRTSTTSTGTMVYAVCTIMLDFSSSGYICVKHINTLTCTL